MKPFAQRLFIAVTIFSLPIAYIPAQSKALDWPDWMGKKRDGVWLETGIVEKFPEGGPEILWRKPIGVGYTGPSVADGHVYVMDWTVDEKKKKELREKQEDKPKNGIEGTPGYEKVICLSAKDGDVVWQHKYESFYNISYANGPRTTPVVDGDHVYTLGAMGKLICFKKKDGKVVWEKDLTTEYKTKPPIWGYASHPLIDGDRLICTVGGEGSAIVAFDKQTGKELWKSLTVGDIGYVPPLLFGSGDSQQLILWHGDGVSSVSAKDGTENWKTKFPEQKAQAQATCIAMPKAVGNKLFFTGFYEGSLLLEVDEKDPTKFKELYRSTKKDLRAKENLNSLMMTPAVKGGHVYGVANDTRGNGMLMCAELKTGKKVWTEKTSLGEGGLGFASLFIVANEDRYFLSNDQGELVIAEMSPEGYKEIDRAKLLEPTHAARGRKVVWSHPAFSGGCMFARNDKEIICVDLRAKKK